MAQDKSPASFAALSEDRRAQAMARLAVLRPHLDDGVPLTRTAACRGRAAADGAALAHALPPGRGVGAIWSFADHAQDRSQKHLPLPAACKPGAAPARASPP